jgi:hypothetical protein
VLVIIIGVILLLGIAMMLAGLRRKGAKAKQHRADRKVARNAGRDRDKAQEENDELRRRPGRDTGARSSGATAAVAEFFDAGESRTVAWSRRPQAAALVAQLAGPCRGWDVVVIGEYERAFYGSQYAAMVPLFEHYGCSCDARGGRPGRLRLRA